MTENFYTPSKVAHILGVSHHCVLERLATGELEAELDPRTGRCTIRNISLEGLGAEMLSEAEAAWRDEKTLLLAELQKERARADNERERADREQEKAARAHERAEGLRRRLRELNAARSSSSRGLKRRLFGG